jgi:hypothetical protein
MPRLGVFFISDGEEKEVAQGQFFEAGAEVYIKRAARIKSFTLGDQINIDPVEFNEIHLLAFFSRKTSDRSCRTSQTN